MRRMAQGLMADRGQPVGWLQLAAHQ